MDPREGITAEDYAVQTLLRKSGKPTYTVINKTEGRGADLVDAFYELGAERLFAISSEHNLGLSDLLDELYPHLAPLEEKPSDPVPKIVLIGRPNAGKSTLINTILKEERLLTSDIAGTTRDTIDTPVSRNNKDYIFIDTAGMRRRGKIKWGVEQYSISRAKGAIKRSNVALLLLDPTEGITEQDTKIAGMVIGEGKGLILIINKSDLLAGDEEGRARIDQQFGFRFSFVHDLPMIYVSALKGKGMTRLFKKIDEVYDAYTKRVSTGMLNRFFERVIQTHPPATYKGKAINLFYITQVGTAPPSFVIFCNISAGVTDQYLRFVQNQLQETFQFWGVPVRVKVRARKRVHLQQVLNKSR
jgi:GTPase